MTTNTNQLIEQLSQSIQEKKPFYYQLNLLKQIETNILSVHFSYLEHTEKGKENDNDLRQSLSLLKQEMETGFKQIKDELLHLKSKSNYDTMFHESFEDTSLLDSPKVESPKNNNETLQENVVTEINKKNTDPSQNANVANASINSVASSKSHRYDKTHIQTDILEKNKQFSSSAIDLNQKILYIQNLFQGNSEDFKEFVNLLSVSKDKNEASEMIEEKLSARVKTNIQADALAGFQEWILSKF